MLQTKFFSHHVLLPFPRTTPRTLSSPCVSDFSSVVTIILLWIRTTRLPVRRQLVDCVMHILSRIYIFEAWLRGPLNSLIVSSREEAPRNRRVSRSTRARSRDLAVADVRTELDLGQFRRPYEIGRR